MAWVIRLATSDGNVFYAKLAYEMRRTGALVITGQVDWIQVGRANRGAKHFPDRQTAEDIAGKLIEGRGELITVVEV